MRELFINYSDSTKTSLVLETEEGDEFFVAVTEELQSLLDDSSDSGSHNGLSSISHLAPAAVSDDPDGDEVEDAEDAAADFESSDEATSSDAATEEYSDEEEVEQDDKADAPSAASAPVHYGPRMVSNVSSEQGSRPYSDAMTMRPAEIQARVRAGASAAELADEMGIAESRVEPFAYPVMLERNNIAEQAKQAHPVREDGPAKLTLWEILATSFAARGHSLSDAEWTAYREQSQPWVIKVSWKAGLSENEALWTFKPSMSSPSTAEARNSVAADLTDPDFVQPVRTLTSIGRGSRYDEAIDGPDSADGRPRLAPVGEEYDDAELRERDEDTPGVYDQEADTSDLAPEDLEGTLAEDAPAAGNSAGHGEESAETDEDEFLQHPDPEKKPTKRRRKAVTPHWEDVLLGVRANTKRPRS